MYPPVCLLLRVASLDRFLFLGLGVGKWGIAINNIILYLGLTHGIKGGCPTSHSVYFVGTSLQFRSSPLFAFVVCILSDVCLYSGQFLFPASSSFFLRWCDDQFRSKWRLFSPGNIQLILRCP